MQPLLQWTSNEYYIFWAFVCSLNYPKSNALASHCHLWLAPLYSIFPHYLINGTIFEKKVLKTKYLFWISLQRLSETFLILRRNERDMIKNVHWPSCKVMTAVLPRNIWKQRTFSLRRNTASSENTKAAKWFGK